MECLICCETMKNQTLNMNCNHSFCFKCFVKMYEISIVNNKNFTCPFCRCILKRNENKYLSIYV